MKAIRIDTAQGEYLFFLRDGESVLDCAVEAAQNKIEKYRLDCLCFPEDPEQASSLRPGDYNRLLTAEEAAFLSDENAARWRGIYRSSFVNGEAQDSDDPDSRLIPEMISAGARLACSTDRLILQDRPARPAAVKPLVSVIVPVMNVEDYLNLALDSLANQTLEEIEFILLNDGSTDHSLTILQEYAETDKRFILIDKPNTGYGHTMNTGLDTAQGECIGILEPDDFADPDMFRRLYEEVSAHGLDFVKSDFFQFTVNENGSLKERPVRLSGDDWFYHRDFTPEKEKRVFLFPINTWTGLYRRDFLERNHIRHHETPGASFQDNGFWFQTFCCCTKIRFVRDRLYHYRVDNPNASMKSRQKEFCITEEYHWIHNWLEKDPQRLAVFEKVMYDKQLRSMLLTYSRLEADRKRPYLLHMRDELAGPFEKKLFDRSLLDPMDWQRLERIVTDPEEFAQTIDVSVIIPVYNGEAYIEECLRTALFPCLVNVEVICVDDGSTDGTAEILKKAAEQDCRIHVYTNDHGGAGAARNIGLQYARGEYLAFLDADDFYEPGMLNRAWHKARTEDLDVVVFPSDNYSMATRTFGSSHGCRADLLPRRRPFAGKDVKQDVFRLFVGWAWDKLFRTEYIRKTGLTYAGLASSNDLSFVFSAIAAAPRINWMESFPLVHHRMYAGSISASRDRTWNCFHDALLELRENLKRLGIFERFERDYINYCLHFSFWQAATVTEETGKKILEKLEGEWFAEFGVKGRPKQYFYHQDQYETMIRIAEDTPEAALERIRYVISHPETMPWIEEKPKSLTGRILKNARTGVWLLQHYELKFVIIYTCQKIRSWFSRR